jgi:exodeoxyribonuclease VII small subunit
MTKENLSFEKIMEDLKKMLSDLEKGDLPLEESMNVYEKAIKLARLGEEKLKSMEGRMEEIAKDGSIKPIAEVAHAISE